MADLGAVAELYVVSADVRESLGPRRRTPSGPRLCARALE